MSGTRHQERQPAAGFRIGWPVAAVTCAAVVVLVGQATCSSRALHPPLAPTHAFSRVGAETAFVEAVSMLCTACLPH
jgi:hypothetical protein